MQVDYNPVDEKIKGKSYDRKLIKKLFPFIHPYKKIFYLSVLLMILITGLELSLPYMTKVAIDRYIMPINSTETPVTKKSQRILISTKTPDAREVVRRHPDLFTQAQSGTLIDTGDYATLSQAEKADLRSDDFSGLTMVAGVMIIIVLLQFIFNFFQKMVMEIAGQNIMHDLRMSLFNHIQSLPVSFFNTNPVGRLVTRVTNDVQNLHELFTSVIIFLFKDLFLIVGIALVLTLISWKLALVSFIVLPFVIYASFYFASHAREVFRQLRVKVSQINTRFSETIQGIKVIQLFRHERQNHDAFQKLNHDNYLAGMQQVHIFAVFLPVIDVLAATALALIIFYGGSGVISHTLSLGDLVAFISYMKMFFRPVRDIADKFNIIQNSMASAERIFLILDELPRPKPPGHKTLKEIESISFQNVDFSYQPGVPVLQDISFTVNKNETLAVVGPTGAGKTSLINLFIRLYARDTGKILINGTDIDAYDTRDLRSRVALVNQDPFLFSGSIKNNILCGTPPAKGYTLNDILDIANCRSFIERLDNGVDTLLSEGATTLSSGERQLISIARAIAGNPDLIILDEATSYIDTESEVKIQEALNNLMSQRTSVIIAHRLSTARKADTILVLNHGRLVESGTHEALLAQKGLYWKLTNITT